MRYYLQGSYVNAAGLDCVVSEYFSTETAPNQEAISARVRVLGGDDCPAGADVCLYNFHELREVPRPSAEDPQPLLAWRVTLDLVCHDIKFGLDGVSGVFAWAGAPPGWAIQEMMNVLVSDALAMRGDSQEFIEYTDISNLQVTLTTDPVTYR